MLVGSAEQWEACQGVLKGHPAFILGNGPFLPDDLSPLNDFFTIGVNRIWYHYDPTVVQWTDNEILPDVEKYIDRSKAIVFVRDEINYRPERFNSLIPYGNSVEPHHRPLPPQYVPATGNMGTAAALWAMSVGCYPVYLLGMSTRYKTDEDGASKTNSYGVNPAHHRPSKIRMVKALQRLLEIKGAYPVLTQETLNRLAELYKPLARGREWYVEQFRKTHRGVYSGQRTAPAAG